MKANSSYKYLLWLLCIPALLISHQCLCQKKMNKLITLWRKDKIPYGTYYAFENMKYIFPNASITINKKSPATFYIDEVNDDDYKKHRKAYIIISPQVLPERSEINAMMNFVGNGNQIFISSFLFGDSLLSYLKLKPENYLNFKYFQDSLRISLYSPVNSDSISFCYPGTSADNYFSSMDTQYTIVLGRDEKGHPNFVKFGYKGGGAIYLQFAPIAFTNFFLLHKNNKAYYENVFSYLPSGITEVKWDDYFRYGKRGQFSALQYIFENKSLSWACWITLLLFAILYVFESKRRQKLIPVIHPPQNSSLDFAKTIGRLYYQQKDNHNLVLKMITHFLDHIRTKFNLPTSALDDEFVDRLFYKSGYDKKELKALIDDIKTFQSYPYPFDDELLQLNKKMELFYKQA